MVNQLILTNANNDPLQVLDERELLRLRQPNALQQRLADIDHRRPLRRIYVMGCGRSGTWLLTHVMNTFLGVEVVLRELPVEYFGLLTTESPVLILKRDHRAYQRMGQILENIEIAYIVRHPFDVLTSQLPGGRIPYHILPDRWRGEMVALRTLAESGRKHTKIIRYEDLVSCPSEWQSELGRFFGLNVGLFINELCTVSDNPTESPTHRSRRLDANSIDKHKRDPQKLAYLGRIKPELGELLRWVSERYRYDISL